MGRVHCDLVHALLSLHCTVSTLSVRNMNAASLGVSLICQSYSFIHACFSIPSYEINNFGEYALEQTYSVVLTALNYFFISRGEHLTPKSQVGDRTSSPRAWPV